jgi:polar amino acid transport system permease protein
MISIFSQKIESLRNSERIIGLLIFAAFGALLFYFVNWSFITSLDFSVVYTYRIALLKGLSITMLLTIVSVVVGLAAGIILAIIYQLPIPPLRWMVVVHVEIWRNTPLLVQLFWVHFSLPFLTGITTSVFVSGIIAMTLQASAYLTEITRAGIEAVPRGQWEASYALGLPVLTHWLNIILPQALKMMIPALAGTTLSFFKATTVLAVLNVGELMTVANTVGNFTFKPIEVLSSVGIVYFIVGYLFSSSTYRLEKALKQSQE